MNCQICRICVIGNTYNLPNGICKECGYLFGSTGTYLGMKGCYHIFRIHNVLCPKCGMQGSYGQFNCDDWDGIDVTDEFEIIKYSHEIGNKSD